MRTASLICVGVAALGLDGCHPSAPAAPTTVTAAHAPPASLNRPSAATTAKWIVPAPPPSIPTLPPANAAASKLRWIGHALSLGEWETVPALWTVTGWRAKAKQRYRVRVKWPGSQTPHLCVSAGSIDEDENDLDEAKELTHSCAKPDATGLSDATVVVPDGGSAVWMTFHSEGVGPPTLQVRIDPS